MRQGWQRSKMDVTSGSERMSKRLYLVAAFAFLLVTPLPAQSFWWRYGSMAEAEAACEEWTKKRGAFRYKWKITKDLPPWVDGPVSGVSSASIRSCHQEEETKQFLGYEYPFKNGFLLHRRPDGMAELKKYFRY